MGFFHSLSFNIYVTHPLNSIPSILEHPVFFLFFWLSSHKHNIFYAMRPKKEPENQLRRCAHTHGRLYLLGHSQGPLHCISGCDFGPKSCLIMSNHSPLKEDCYINGNCYCCSVTSLYLTLWPHGLQHYRLPCPSPSPRGSLGDCQEKHQQQICRWYHSNGRKWRGTKEPLDEAEEGEWKSQLKIQY